MNLDEIISVLEFYANEENWHRTVSKYSGAKKPSKVMKDEGKMARHALKLIASKKSTAPTEEESH